MFVVFYPANVLAITNFNIDVQSGYKINEEGKAHITNTVNIINNNPNLYSKSFIFNIFGQNPDNIRIYEKGDLLNFDKKTYNSNTELRVHFKDSVVGIDNSRTFLITYEDNSLFKQTSDIKEIYIPKLTNTDNFNNYTVKISVPASFGEDMYISQEPRSVMNSADVNEYLFYKNDFQDSGIKFIFGEFQTFSFNLNFHIENPLKKSSVIEVAIPPDTALQEMYYKEILPRPREIKVDDDGNWLALFELKPREKLDIKTSGYARIFSKSRSLIQPKASTLLKNTLPTQYWQSEDPLLKEAASNLNSPEDIYNFVVNKLSYNFDRVKPNIERYGAKAAFLSPTDAICMEFTDLFIALARAKGIPAREINGFAYSDNPRVLPLSLVADVLHAWPEYWSDIENNWISVDPTWEATSGQDYFNSFDLKHFTFAIHGIDSQKPYSAGSYKLGTNPQKDVYILPSELGDVVKNDIKIEYKIINSIPFLKGKLEVEFVNTGQNALYNVKPEIFLSDKQYHTKYIEVLPPYSSYGMDVEFKWGFLAKYAPAIIKIAAYRTETEIPINKNRVIIFQLFIIFLSILSILLVIFYRIKGKNKIKINEIYKKLQKIFTNKRKHS
ncbi:hypothetical protein A2863_01850 [Candidatus Woesebacteria bacterium RIFCSPHIGHO2_01_FULL_38_9b]|uniref:Transglutaminase-like domain-containing protein n=1 Tax=Candidatus Woesebacteria bacterium RIFCSPHIGHO2_01_FULL_38_9b TaxID=1802493 RepID=A0A1F7XYF5_9BACT|nr:MAG: hypothetical protein A2863_01850 [Candidatus Woesebacteria bacterium RIFCSPHIGHO2_01_FULL_38_9b]